MAVIYEGAVPRPSVTPLTSTVLDHATVAEIERFGVRNEAGLWSSYNCLDTLVPTPICPDPEDREYKTFDIAPWVPGYSFAVHAGVQCSAVGLDQEDMVSELGRVFRANEAKGVERSLLANRFVASAPDRLSLSGQEVGWDAPTDITPGASISLAVALALLEGYAAANYTGVPTIHMPRAAASLLGSDKIVWEGDKAYTRLGSKVAMGGGYDQQGLPQNGEWDLYATGEVYVERSTEVALRSFVLPGDGSGTGSDENGLVDNTVIALNERMYRVGVDCFVAKATGTVWS